MPATRPALTIARAVILLGIGITLVCTSRTVRHGGTTGDFPVFVTAGQKLVAGEDIYSKTEGVGEYIYPPPLAAIFAPLSELGPAGAAWAWATINTAILLAVPVLVARDAARRFRINPTPATVLGAALIGLALSFDKSRAVISGGQSDMLMVLGVSLGLVYHDRRPAVSGAALALAAVIKYTPLAFVPYLLIRGHRRAAVWTLVFFVVFALAPALVCGWSRNLEYWGTALGGVARLFGYTGAATFAPSIQNASHPASLSITSALSRVIPGHVALAAAAFLALLVAAVSFSMYPRRGIPFFGNGRGPAAPAMAVIEWSGILIATLAFSPQTQGRHLVQLLPVHTLGAALLIAPPPGVPRRWLILGLLILEAAMTLPPGSRAFEPAVFWWQAFGGAGWCMLPFWFALLWTGLRACKSLPDETAGTPVRQ